MAGWGEYQHGGVSDTTESFIPLKCWPLNPWQRKKQMEMGPSGVLKHCDGKGGRLFIVLLPSDPLLFDWLCPQDERSRTLSPIFMCSDEAPFKSQLICHNQPAICSTEPTTPANQPQTPGNPSWHTGAFLSHNPLPPPSDLMSTSSSLHFHLPSFLYLPMARGCGAHGDLGWGPSDPLHHYLRCD